MEKFHGFVSPTHGAVSPLPDSYWNPWIPTGIRIFLLDPRIPAGIPEPLLGSLNFCCDPQIPAGILNSCRDPQIPVGIQKFLLGSPNSCWNPWTPAGITKFLLGFLLEIPNSCWDPQIPSGIPSNSSSTAQIPPPKIKTSHPNTSKSPHPIFAPNPWSQILALQGFGGAELFFLGGGVGTGAFKSCGSGEGEGSRCWNHLRFF